VAGGVVAGVEEGFVDGVVDGLVDGVVDGLVEGFVEGVVSDGPVLGTLGIVSSGSSGMKMATIVSFRFS